MKNSIARFMIALTFSLFSATFALAQDGGGAGAEIGGAGSDSGGAGGGGAAGSGAGGAPDDPLPPSEIPVEAAEAAPAEVANVDTGEVPTRQEVLDSCATLSLAECTALVREYMDDLVASGITQEEINQIAATFVVELNAAAQTNPEIDSLDVKVVDAIRAVVTYVDDPDQIERIAGIADTIEANEDFQTAAVIVRASPN